MPNLALADLVIPYLLKADNLGATHAALSVIRVISYETASDPLGVVIRGKAEINGNALIDVRNGTLTIEADTFEGSPPFDPNRKDPIFDIRETVIDFELYVPREGSDIIAQGVQSITDSGFAPLRTVLDALDAPPLNAAPSDYPTSGFRFDFIVQAPSVRPPFLHPARMTDRGLLVPDPAFQEVRFNLPKLRFQLAHGNPLSSRLRFEILSVGSSGLDDPADMGVAELVSMEPPYAFIGSASDRAVGFGFRKAVLDLSRDSTPADILEKFGFGDDWAGLYLPEARIFIAPEGAKDLAMEAGVEDLLIGFGEHAGISGDFEVALINQGFGDLQLNARFFDDNGKAYGMTKLTATTGRAQLPANTHVVIDVQGGMPPYNPVTLKVGNNPVAAGRLFKLDLSAGQQTLEIRAEDSSPAKKTATLTVDAYRITAQNTLPVPGAQYSAPSAATLDPPAAGAPRILIASQTDTAVTLTTAPPSLNTLWKVGSAAEATQGQPSITVPVASGQTVTVQARFPEESVPSTLSFYYFFDEPKAAKSPADEDDSLRSYALIEENISTGKAVSKNNRNREAGAQSALKTYKGFFDTRVPNNATITVTGQASNEGDNSTAKRDYNYLLARRRAKALALALQKNHGSKNFTINFVPKEANPYDHPNLANWTTQWQTQTAPVDNSYWRADIALPNNLSKAEQKANATVKRPPQQIIIPPPDPVPPTPAPPSWFRSAKIKARIFKNNLVGLEMAAEIDFQTAAEQRMNASGQAVGATPSRVGTLQNGTPLAHNNPGDGMTKFRVFYQMDQATGRIITQMQVGADPADTDGLIFTGWMPGDLDKSQSKWRDLMGAYLTFWPLLVKMTEGNKGAVESAVLTGAALAIPATITALDMFHAERIILFGVEYMQREQGGAFESFLLFDVEVDWSADIRLGSMKLLSISAEQPLAVRYKSIGLRLGNYDEQGNSGFSFRPVFDASKGYTIDVARGGSLQVADPFGKILKILGARLSRTNPLTFEVDLGVAIDLGVVTIDRARVRVYMDDPNRLPELTAFGASIDVPGAIAGSGYLEMSEGSQPGTSRIGGQIDVTVRPVGLRVAAAFEMAQEIENNKEFTAIYLSLNVVLPVGIPLGSSGLGLFGFRGIFGMHYQRNTDLGNAAAAPALRWLEASGGQPHLLKHNNEVLWKPKYNEWAFGVGTVLGTMEGGVLMNLDGTLLIELPGPRVLIVMNARIISPPPFLDDMGAKGGVLAVIEITPEHFLIGVILNYEIESLIKLRVPVEAYFDFVNVNNWHFYLGQRSQPIEVDVLGLVKGTGYFMVRGNGLEALQEKNLPAIDGFALGLGAAASITFGDVDSGLYLRVGGSMDAVMGFDPFILAGNFQLYGKLRLFVVSIGASANLDVKVIEKNGMKIEAKGHACGHVDFFFFEVEGCVHVTIGGFSDKPDMPVLVNKLSIKSRSPALLVGTGVDRPIDTSLGDGLQGDNAPALNDNALITVPIDSIPVISMAMTPQAPGLQFMNKDVLGSSGLSGDAAAWVARGKEKYQYKVTNVTLERHGGGSVMYGTNAPATWWTQSDVSGNNPVSQLALFTYEPEPASKAIEKTECRKESIKDRWGAVCNPAAEPVPVMWTFLLEKMGASATGWSLEGEAWPDAANTQRSRDADTTLNVTERWRTGNKAIDNLRGIIPAVVTGSRFACKRKKTPLPPRFRDIVVPKNIDLGVLVGRQLDTKPLSMDTAVRSLRDFKPNLALSDARAARVISSKRLLDKLRYLEPIPPAPVDPVAVVDSLMHGGKVTRDALLATLFGMADGNKDRITGQCETRVLQAPMLDIGKAIVFGDTKNTDTVERYLEKNGHKHGPLDNVVVLHTGALKDGWLLLYVYGRYLGMKHVQVRTLAEDGSELWSHYVDTADRVGTAHPLPASWTAASSIWAEEVEDVMGWSHDPRSRNFVPVLIKIQPDEKIDRIEIGAHHTDDSDLLKNGKGNILPSYYVAALEAMRHAEAVRASWDEYEVRQEREAITRVLGPAGTDDALLVPDALYKVSVTWEGKRQSDNQTASDTQSFWFKTDAAAPARLDPWVMMSTPFDGEGDVFGAEPLQLVFNTHDIDRLYDAYGKELRVKITASSSNHPAEPKPNAFVIGKAAGTLKGAGAAVLSPWEESLVEALKENNQTCIPVDEDRSRQSSYMINVPLEPYTDYKFDVEMVDKGAAKDAVGERVYRRSFSTGGYGKLVELANAMQAVRVQHRAAKPGLMGILHSKFAGKAPQGAELDEAFRAEKMEAPEVSQEPRITVFWEQNGNAAPQPTAVLMDAPAALWRARPFPEQITDDTAAGSVQRWIMGEKPCLTLDRKAGSADIVESIIRAPGGQRALIILKAGSRSKRLQLDLVRPAINEPWLSQVEESFPVVDIALTKALWEE